jgi:hypothetical protein
MATSHARTPETRQLELEAPHVVPERRFGIAEQ